MDYGRWTRFGKMQDLLSQDRPKKGDILGEAKRSEGRIPMKHFTHLATGVVLFSLLYLLFPQTAYAYLDPGTGSYIIQMAIAILLGASFTIKIYWKKIKTYFAKFSSKKQKNDV